MAVAVADCAGDGVAVGFALCDAVADGLALAGDVGAGVVVPAAVGDDVAFVPSAGLPISPLFSQPVTAASNATIANRDRKLNFIAAV